MEKYLNLVICTSSAATAGPSDLLEAVATVHRAVATWLERYLSLLAAVAAYNVEQLAWCSRGAAIAFALVATLSPTGATTLGVVKAASGVELLVVRIESKFLVAVRTN